MKENFTMSAEKGIQNLRKNGAFLTVKCGDKVNVMTIGWGNAGFEWGKPIFTILVRKSRYTHELIEKSGEFTVSIPFDDKFKQELTVCGTKSGRNADKVKECKLKLFKGASVSTPVVDGCNLYYECKIVYKHDMNAQNLDDSIIKSCYGDNDYHTIYYGEIVNVYTK